MGTETSAMHMRVMGVAAVLSLSVSAVALAQSMPVKPKVNGYWEIDDSSRRPVVSPQYTPAGKAMAEAAATAAAARPRAAVGLGTYLCDYQPFPFMLGTSEPWSIVATKDEVVQIFERPGMRARHFYTDGRELPDMSKMPAGGNGYSVARWEGEDLIVRTVGLAPGPFRGGAFKTPAANYMERLHVEPDNQWLSVTYTVEDPVNLEKPYSFTYKYARNPIGSTYAFGDFCDPHDDNAHTVDTDAQAVAAAEAAGGSRK